MTKSEPVHLPCLSRCCLTVKNIMSIFWTFITVRNSNCGKVMFFYRCLSVHGGLSGQTPPRQTPPQADTPQADTPPGRHPLGRPQDGHCSGRYASYWNAFLSSFCNHLLICHFWDSRRSRLFIIGVISKSFERWYDLRKVLQFWKLTLEWSKLPQRKYGPFWVVILVIFQQR